MHPNVTVIRCELPSPDMIYVNHPRGLLLLADPRVDEERIQTMLSIIRRRVALHPDYYAAA